MKKFLAVLLVAGSLVACNDSADGGDNTKDSIDSVANAQKDRIDSSAEARKEAIDSSAEAKKEAADRLDSLNRRDSANIK